ncbi:MAG: starch-binding protein, partial [Oscillospiraceae bacterium]|nr:starch-binding protein [Oscillospiraceae bacterium]
MKMKRNLKRTISVVLTVLMILSTMIVGVVTVNAATTIYFKNTNGWTNVRIYGYNDSNTSVYGGWPGTTVTLVNGTTDVYSVELKSDTDKIIFNDTSDSNTKQTVDITDVSTQISNGKNMVVCNS